VPKYSFECVFV